MNYVNEQNMKEILDGISKKIPRGIVNGDTQVGHITWQMYLLKDYLKLDGTPLANASNDYADLLKFSQDNNLITADTTDNSLFKYDSTTDVLTLPNYIDLVLQGGNSVEEKEAGLPNIKDSGSSNLWLISGLINEGTVYDGAVGIEVTSDQSNGANGTGYKYIHPRFNASNYNSIYSDTVDTVQPPAIILIPQIKYRKATTMYEQIDAVVNYSTTEKVVGTWIDGKPLYQITIQDTMPTVTTDGTMAQKDIDISLLNANKIMNISGIIFSNNSESFVDINSITNVTPQFRCVFCKKVDMTKNYIDTLVIRETTISYSNASVYITIQYTKTID